MKCNWCANSRTFKNARELRDHKYMIHDAERQPEFRAQTRRDISDDQILSLIRSGESIRTAADMLHVAHNTMAYRLAQIFIKNHIRKEQK